MARALHAGAVEAHGSSVSDPAGSGSVLALALAFFVTACGLAVFFGASLAALHAFAAFLVLAIVAASNQLLPVLLRIEPLPAWNVQLFGASFATGFALLVAAFAGAPTFAVAGIWLAATAFVWVVWTIGRILRAKAESQTGAIVAVALAIFAFAAFVGATLAGVLGGSGDAAMLRYAPVHGMLMLAGFATLLIVAISYRLVPMFSISHANAYGRRVPQWIVAIAAAGAALSAGFPPVERIMLLTLMAAGGWIAYSHVQTLRSRLRRRLDVSLRYAAVAWSFGFLAAIAALASTWHVRFGAAAIAFALLGWISISILGYMYKIVGFLTWQSARSRLSGAILPPLGGAVPDRLANAGLALLAAGTLAAGTLLGAQSEWSRTGFIVYAAGALCAAVALAKLALTFIRANGDARAV